MVIPARLLVLGMAAVSLACAGMTLILVAAR
jgi:hypothetical protein